MIETTETDQNNITEYGIFWGADMLNKPSEKAHLIEHFLYERDTIFISAQSGVGKSILTMQMLASLTSGQPFLGSFQVSRPCKVLYLQTEGDRSETIDRIKAMERGVAFNHANWVHVNLDGICLNTPEGYKQFIDLISAPKMKYDVVIIDPLYTTVKGSLNNDDVATDWVRYMRSVRKIYGCAFIVVHHESIKEVWVDGQKLAKGAKDLMGSTYWGAFVTYNFKLTHNAKEGTYTLASGKERNKKVIDTVKLKMIEPSPLMYVIADDTFTLSEATIKNLIIASPRTLEVKEIIKLTNVSRATAYRTIRKLLEDKMIVKHEDDGIVRYGKL